MQDSQDPNPLIRALAVRTMGCIRVDKITEYLCDPLQRTLKVCCLKIPDCETEAYRYLNKTDCKRTTAAKYRSLQHPDVDAQDQLNMLASAKDHPLDFYSRFFAMFCAPCSVNTMPARPTY